MLSGIFSEDMLFAINAQSDKVILGRLKRTWSTDLILFDSNAYCLIVKGTNEGRIINDWILNDEENALSSMSWTLVQIVTHER